MSLAGKSARASLSASRGRSSVAGEEFEILEIHEKHGPLYNAIPCMPLGAAIFLLILNIFVPGLGTFLSSFACLCGCKTKLGKPVKAFLLNVLTALLQMIFFVVIVGWLWSIIWGMNFCTISSESRKADSAPPEGAASTGSALGKASVDEAGPVSQSGAGDAAIDGGAVTLAPKTDSSPENTEAV